MEASEAEREGTAGEAVKVEGGLQSWVQQHQQRLQSSLAQAQAASAAAPAASLCPSFLLCSSPVPHSAVFLHVVLFLHAVVFLHVVFLRVVSLHAVSLRVVSLPVCSGGGADDPSDVRAASHVLLLLLPPLSLLLSVDASPVVSLLPCPVPSAAVLVLADWRQRRPLPLER